MAEHTITNPDASKTTVKAPEPAQPDRKPKPGDDVEVVLADGKLAPAKVTKVRGGEKRLVDLEFSFRDEPVVVTSSPFDADGKRCDSWRWPVEAPEAVKA